MIQVAFMVLKWALQMDATLNIIFLVSHSVVLEGESYSPTFIISEISFSSFH